MLTVFVLSLVRQWLKSEDIQRISLFFHNKTLEKEVWSDRSHPVRNITAFYTCLSIHYVSLYALSSYKNQLFPFWVPLYLKKGSVHKAPTPHINRHKHL